MTFSSQDIQYFLEVASSQNVTRAAQRLGITQPSLSLAIRRLESALKTTLLIRTTKGVTLTEGGNALVAGSRVLLQAWQDIHDRVSRSRSEVAGKVTIGCHSEVAIDSLPLFMSELLETYPNLDIRLIHDLSRKILADVIDFKIDIGLVVNPAPHPDLVIRNLSKDRVMLWRSAKPKPMHNLKNGTAVLICDPELAQSKIIVQRLKRKGLRFSRLLATADLEVVTTLTASGAGLGILPSEVATRYPFLQLKPLDIVSPVMDEVAVVYRMENRDARSIRSVVELIIASHAKKYS